MKIPFFSGAKKAKKATSGEANKGGSSLFIILAMIMVGCFLASGWLMYIANNRIQNNVQYIDYITTAKLVSQQIIPNATQAAQGVDLVAEVVKKQQRTFSQALDGLINGSPETGLPPLDDVYSAELGGVRRSWAEYNSSLDTIVGAVTRIDNINFQLDYLRNTYFDSVRQELEKLTNEFLRIKNIDRYYEVTQIASLVRISVSTLTDIIVGDADTTSEAFVRYQDNYADYKSSIDRFPKKFDDNFDIEIPVRKLNNLAASGQDFSDTVIVQATNLVSVKEASGVISRLADNTLSTITALEIAVQEQNEQNRLLTYIGIGAGAAGLVLMILLGLLLIRSARRREQESVNTNRSNQNSILRLLDEMSSLAEGDLTVHATVTEDITGAIADSVNFSIDALRNMVTTIDSTANEVSSSSQKTQQVVSRLREASTQQRNEITDTTSAITQMAETMESISESAKTSSQVALRSIEIANKGAETVTRNIDGMDTIREQIQGTSKRIKRLGESSQQIGEIVSLITDLADRTSILALNAAIQASSAGDAGRGFAVVADEVQRLAERAGSATKQISGLVETIQYQ